MNWRQLRFSAGFWFFLIALALLLWGRHLPWPLNYLRYAIWPYVAFAIMLMHITGLDITARLSEAGPHMLFISAFSLGRYAAVYVFASLIIVSFVAGHIYSNLVQRIVSTAERRNRATTKKQDNATIEIEESAPHFSSTNSKTDRRVPIARLAALIVFSAFIVANIRGEASTRQKGSVSFTPLHVRAWKHGMPLPWLVQDMWPEESRLIEESRRTPNPITHRWWLNDCINRTINGDASWRIHAAAMDIFIAVFFSIAVGMGIDRLFRAIRRLISIHASIPINERSKS